MIIELQLQIVSTQKLQGNIWSFMQFLLLSASSRNCWASVNQMSDYWLSLIFLSLSDYTVIKNKRVILIRGVDQETGLFPAGTFYLFLFSTTKYKTEYSLIPPLI